MKIVQVHGQFHFILLQSWILIVCRGLMARIILSNPEFLGSKYPSLPIDGLIFHDVVLKSSMVCE